MSTPGRKTPTFDLMRRLYRQMPSNLQRRIYIVIAMMIGGAFLEVISLGAILPFLALVSTPDRAWAYLDKLGIHSILGFPREDIVYLAGIAFVLISITAAFARTGLAWYLNRFVFAVGRHFSHTLLTNTLHQAYRYHLTKNTSETISTIQEVRSIAISVLQPMMQVASSITVGIFIIVSLVLLDPMIAFTAFISLATVYLLISALLRRMIGTNAKIMETLRSRRIQVAQEALGGIRDVLLDSSQKVFIEQFSSLDRRISNAQAANNFAGTAPRYAVEATGMVLITVAALYFNSQPGGIIAALPVLAALALGAQRLLPLMQQGYTASVQVSTYAGLASNLLQILEAAPPREYSGPPPSEAMPLREGITFNNVRFRYQSDMDDVLNGLDIHIPKGSRVGIIGSTGSGKSTTVDLLMGLLEPSSGELLIDGVALNKADRRAWHMAIAHVPQAIYLTDASLAANIAFGCRPEEIDMVRVEEAARKAELADFIATLPQGYDTGVGERGVRLSGGQRQRVGIARALYKNPSVLVLDEGTSALDNATEAAVMKSIEALDRDLTIVMIAHRLSTIAGCDFAVRLDKGKSVERLEPRDLDQLRVPMH